MLPFVLFILWVITMVFLRKIKMHFFVFLVGSAGLFCFLMYIGLGSAEKYLEYAVTYLISLIGDFSGLYKAYPEYSSITIYYKNQAISFFVDYECSGFIETLVYVCLLLFYPVYNYREKILYTVIGIIYIFIANVARVFIICLIIKLFGSPLFFFSHTLFARVLFFAFMVVIYYIVFTRPHILRQKVGGMSYAAQ
ncbi:MAG: exosortase family protein XrtG [Clostridia bacterium]|nr:exosortase family protein XrtG [Clostridia bacterium]